MSSSVAAQRVVAIWRRLIVSVAVASASISPCLGQSHPMVPHHYEPETPTETPDGDVVSLKTADGMLVIWNRSVPYFTMSVPGNDYAHRDWDFANMKRSLGETSRVRTVLSHLDDAKRLVFQAIGSVRFSMTPTDVARIQRELRSQE